MAKKGIEIVREKYDLSRDEEVALKQIDAMKTENTIFLLFKRMSYLIKLTSFQSSCGDFALSFSRMDHGVTCCMSITRRTVESL